MVPGGREGPWVETPGDTKIEAPVVTGIYRHKMIFFKETNASQQSKMPYSDFCSKANFDS
jgi:hypothetical protein